MPTFEAAKNMAITEINSEPPDNGMHAMWLRSQAQKANDMTEAKMREILARGQPAEGFDAEYAAAKLINKKMEDNAGRAAQPRAANADDESISFVRAFVMSQIGRIKQEPRNHEYGESLERAALSIHTRADVARHIGNRFDVIGDAARLFDKVLKELDQIRRGGRRRKSKTRKTRKGRKATRRH